jgi:UDP-glucose 4-epimerase
MILVTGGAGHIGRWLVQELVKHSYKVTVIDIQPRPSCFKHLTMNYIQFDLTHPELVKEYIQGASIVIHLAALIEVPEGQIKPKLYIETNLMMTANILSIMAESNHKQSLIFASTAAIYNLNKPCFQEEDDIYWPYSIYGITKRMSEELIINYTTRYPHLRAVIVRFFNVVTGSTDTHHLIPTLYNQHLQRSPWYIYGNDYPTRDGTCLRDYIHILDLVDAILSIISFLPSMKYDYRIFNLGSGKGYTVKEVMELCKQHFNCPEHPVIINPRRDGDVSVLVADITRAQTELGWNPKREMLEGLY